MNSNWKRNKYNNSSYLQKIMAPFSPSPSYKHAVILYRFLHSNVLLFHCYFFKHAWCARCLTIVLVSFSAFCTWNSILKIQCISLKKFNSRLITLPFSTILLPASRVFHCKYPCFVIRDMFYVTIFSIIGVLSTCLIGTFANIFIQNCNFLRKKYILAKHYIRMNQ